MIFKDKTILISRIIALSCLLSVGLSLQLWLNERTFPSTPVFNFLAFVSHPIDYIFLVIFLLLLIGIIFLKKNQKLIITFLIVAFLFAIQDINRWQPWFYQYVLMLFVLSFYNPNTSDTNQNLAIRFCFKIMIASIYFWSGLQKLNSNFIIDAFPWLMEPIINQLKIESINSFIWLGYSFPIIETCTGVFLLFNKTKKIAAFIAILMHLFILYILGPFGHNYNYVVWPWNFCMIYFNYELFLKKSDTIKSTFSSIKKYYYLITVLFFFTIMPLLNFFNKWDSYLSHNLYSGNTSNGYIYLSNSVVEKLPLDIKKHVHRNGNWINIKSWCMKELGIPPYPEKRNFESISNTFYKYTNDSTEIYFEFTPKSKVNI